MSDDLKAAQMSVGFARNSNSRLMYQCHMIALDDECKRLAAELAKLRDDPYIGSYRHDLAVAQAELAEANRQGGTIAAAYAVALSERDALRAAAADLLQYLDDHDWGHVPEGAAADRLRDLIGGHSAQPSARLAEAERLLRELHDVQLPQVLRTPFWERIEAWLAGASEHESWSHRRADQTPAGPTK